MKKLNIQIPKMMQVDSSYCGRYSNSHHLQFQFNMYELVKAVDKLKLHLTDELLKTWADCLEQETELNKQATAMVQTEGTGSKRHYQLAIKGQTEADGTPKTMWVGMNKDGSLFPFEKTTTTKTTTTKPAVGPKP